MKQEIQDIVFKIEKARVFEKAIQPTLREYVLDKTQPLEERFDVWSKYCKKIENSWRIGNGEFGCLGKYVDDFCDNFSRYANYDWEYFFEQFSDGFAELETRPNDTWRLKVENYIGSLDEFKEQLIETNFGSFTFDW